MPAPLSSASLGRAGKRSEEETKNAESSISDELDAVVTAVTGAAEDLVDTVKATAKVIGEKISEKI